MASWSTARARTTFCFAAAPSANCNDNLVDAITPFGLGAGDVHDPFNIFMTTGLNGSGKPFYLPSDARKGDYVDLLAEMNVLVAISACPGGSSGKQSYPLELDIFGREYVSPDVTEGVSSP